MLASNIFEGAAFYYARYQPEYPKSLFNILGDKLNLSRDSKLLDLGCGTGQIALGISDKVGHIDCIDPNREMLDEARRLTSQKDVRNISFLETTSEALDPSYRGYGAATIASAFHWMDRSRVLESLGDRLQPRGGIAVVTRIRDQCDPNDWWNAIWEFVRAWWGGSFPAGKDDIRRELKISNEETLRLSSFSSVTSVSIPYSVEWSTETLIQYIYSTSKACPGVLTEERAEFEQQLKSVLYRLSPNGVFLERSHIEILFGFRP